MYFFTAETEPVIGIPPFSPELYNTPEISSNSPLIWLVFSNHGLDAILAILIPKQQHIDYSKLIEKHKILLWKNIMRSNIWSFIVVYYGANPLLLFLTWPV